jgi:hypothetical protein
LICFVNSPSQNWGEPTKLVVERDLDKTRIYKKSKSEEAQKTRSKIRERLLGNLELVVRGVLVELGHIECPSVIRSSS